MADGEHCDDCGIWFGCLNAECTGEDDETCA